MRFCIFIFYDPKVFSKDGEAFFFDKLKNYTKDPWNIFDFFGCSLFVIGMVLRFFSLFGNENLFKIAKYIYIILKFYILKAKNIIK